MPEYDLTITVIGKDRASGAFNSLEYSLRRIFETALGVTLSRVLVNIADSFVKLAATAVDATAQIQLMRVNLSALVTRELIKASNGTLEMADALAQAQPLAKNLMDELSRMAILSPFTVSATQNTFRLNMAFGYTAKQATLMTNGLLEMASGLGADNEQLRRMAYNLAQVRLQNKVTALDVRQLALAGLDLEDVLRFVSSQMGYNIKDHLEFNKLIAQGKISWDEFAVHFAEYADKYFKGSSEMMARTLYGLKSTFSDVFVLTMPQIIGPSIEKVTKILNGFLNIFIKARDLKIFEKWGERFGAAADKLLGPLTKFTDFINEYLDLWTRFDELTANFDEDSATGGISALMGMMGGMPSLLGMIQYGIEKAFGPEALATFNNWVSALDKLKTGDWFGALKDIGVDQDVLDFIDDIRTGFANLKTFWDENGDAIMGIFGDIAAAIWGAIAPGAETRVEAIGTGFSGFTQMLIDDGPTIVENLGKVRDYIVDELIPGLQDFFTNLTTVWIPKMQEFINLIITNWPTIQPILITAAVAFLALAAGITALQVVLPTLISLTGIIVVLAASGLSLTAILTILGVTLGVALLIFGAVVVVVGALVAVVYVLITHWNQVVSVVTNVAGTISSVLMPVWTVLTTSLQLWIQLWGAVFNVISAVAGLLVRALVFAFQQLMLAIKPVNDTIATMLAPALQSIADLWNGTLQPALKAMWTMLTSSIKPAWDSIVDVIKKIIDWLNRLADLIRSIDFGQLQSKSPTPFEMGLRGINRELAKMQALVRPVADMNFGNGQAGAGGQPSLAGQTTYYFAPVTVQTPPDQDPYSWLAAWR